MGSYDPNVNNIHTRLQTSLLIIEQFLTERGMLISTENVAVLPFTRRHLDRFERDLNSHLVGKLDH